MDKRQAITREEAKQRVAQFMRAQGVWPEELVQRFIQTEKIPYTNLLDGTISAATEMLRVADQIDAFIASLPLVQKEVAD